MHNVKIMRGLLSNIIDRFYWLILYIVIRLSDLEKRAEETEDIDLH